MEKLYKGKSGPKPTGDPTRIRNQETLEYKAATLANTPRRNANILTVKVKRKHGV